MKDMPFTYEYHDGRLILQMKDKNCNEQRYGNAYWRKFDKAFNWFYARHKYDDADVCREFIKWWRK